MLNQKPRCRRSANADRVRSAIIGIVLSSKNSQRDTLYQRIERRSTWTLVAPLPKAREMAHALHTVSKVRCQRVSFPPNQLERARSTPKSASRSAIPLSTPESRITSTPEEKKTRRLMRSIGGPGKTNRSPTAIKVRRRFHPHRKNVSDFIREWRRRLTRFRHPFRFPKIQAVGLVSRKRL